MTTNNIIYTLSLIEYKETQYTRYAEIEIVDSNIVGVYNNELTAVKAAINYHNIYNPKNKVNIVSWEFEGNPEYRIEDNRVIILDQGNFLCCLARILIQEHQVITELEE